MAGRVVLNRANIDALLRSPAGPVYRHIDGIARRTANQAKREAPVREGTMRASISSSTSSTSSAVVGRVEVGVGYALYVLRGTGIYGPSGRVITPKRARVLRFTTSGGHGPLARGRRRPAAGRGGVVFARYVRGTPKNPFLIEAFKAVSPYPVRELSA